MRNYGDRFSAPLSPSNAGWGDLLELEDRLDWVENQFGANSGRAFRRDLILAGAPLATSVALAVGLAWPWGTLIHR